MSKPMLSLGRTEHGAAISHAEFAEAQFDEPWRYERVKGRLIVMNPPGHDHHITVEPFRNHLGAYKLAHPDVVEFVVQESWTLVDDETERLPDIAVYLRTGSTSARIPERVPELVFEIVSESADDRRRDYVEKRADYERAGVQEYVIVDRFEHRLTVLRLTKRQYAES